MNRIKELRVEKHKTQKEIAKFLNITEQALSHYERGLREPKLKTWQALANYFDVSVPYLQGISEHRKLTDYPSAIFGNNPSYSKEIQDEARILYDAKKRDDTLEIDDAYKCMIGKTFGNMSNIIFDYLLLRHDEWSDSYKEKQLETVVAIYEFIEKMKEYFYSINYTKLRYEKDKEKQARLGHSNVQTTLNIYTHAIKDKQDKIGDEFAKYINLN